MVIISNSRHKNFTKKFLDWTSLIVNVQYFSDNGFVLRNSTGSEPAVLIHSVVCDRDFVELLVILSNYNVKIVCFLYNIYFRNSFSVDFIVNILKKYKVNTIVTLEAHTLHRDVVNINMFKFWTNKLGDQYSIVSPDVGAMRRNYRTDIKLKKKRSTDGSISITGSDGEISGMDCLIIDDLVDSGKTIKTAAEFLLTNGAKSINIAATHMIPRERNLFHSAIEKIFITNSIIQNNFPDNTEVIDISEFLVKKLTYLLKNNTDITL